jgi:DNA-binding response OmpR family regulator
MRALSRVGFGCEAAPNGALGLEMAKQSRYDVVVTDLRMPEANGHQLAVELLAMPSRPAIVVLTGVAEPKLANDLRMRGVDEILFKPVKFELLANTVRSIVDQRARTHSFGETQAPAKPSVAAATEATGDAGSASQPPVMQQLAKAGTALKSPPKDFDCFANASGSAFSRKGLTDAIELAPSLAGEVLRFANRVVYSSHQALADLQRSTASFQQNAVWRALGIFISGVLVGWLLSWLGGGRVMR